MHSLWLIYCSDTLRIICCLQTVIDQSKIGSLEEKSEIFCDTMSPHKKDSSRSVVSYISDWICPYVEHVCKFFVDEFLSRSISQGCLKLIFTDGSQILFGESVEQAKEFGRPIVKIFVENSASFYGRVASSADIGFSEAFISGDISVEKSDDLVDVFTIFILNRDNGKVSTSSLLVSRFGSILNRWLHSLNRNTISGSQRNIEAHYDLSNELFGTFLGESWTYSCGYFNEDVKNLDQAQFAKIDKILDKARISEDCHILEIGCGWGELSIRAVERFGCYVTAITLSHEQLSLAKKRAIAAGVGDKIDFQLIDYRVLAGQGRKFDRIVSVEMLEAVGHEFLGSFFKAVNEMLTSKGLVVLQVITTPENRYEEYRKTTDFIQKHIFPGGICPSLQALMDGISGNSDLIIEEIENIGVHYATTLKEWRRKFLKSVENGQVKEAGFDEMFVRKWIYYFCYCEAGFSSRTLGTLQMVLTRGNNVETLGGRPCMEMEKGSGLE